MDKKFAGQVIIEKGFDSEEAARNWMGRIKNKYEPTADNVETHLRTDAGSWPTRGKGVNTRLDEDTRLGRNNPFNYSLRNSEDEIEPQPCKGCGQPLRTYKDEVRHEIKHVQEGTFIAWVGTVTSLLVHFTPKKDERYVGGVVIPFEHLDWSTNHCRVVCPTCGNFCYFGYRDGKWYWKHYKRMRWTGRDWVRSSADDNEYYPDHEVDLPLPEPPEEQG